MENPQFIKSEAFSIAGLLEYLPNAIVIKTIARKTTGTISALAFDSGEALVGKVSPYDTFLHLIEGNAEVVIDDISSLMVTGQSIIIPAHSRNTMKANVRFKMLCASIKSGYEEVI